MGVDFDPKGDMVLDVKDDGDCEVKYKGQKMDYDTYVDELEDRATRNQQGRSITTSSIGTFSGVDFDKDGNIKKPHKLKN